MTEQIWFDSDLETEFFFNFKMLSSYLTCLKSRIRIC